MPGHRVLIPETAVGVEHETHVVADRGADPLHGLDGIAGAHDAGMNLVRAKPLVEQLLCFSNVSFRRLVTGRIRRVDLRFVPLRPKELVDRHPRLLAGDVPQGHVHGRPRRHAQAAPVHQDAQAVPEPLTFAGVPPHELRLEYVQNLIELSVAARPKVADEAVSLDAVVGRDSQDALFGRAGEAAQVRVQARGRKLSLYYVYSNVGYFHIFSLIAGRRT